MYFNIDTVHHSVCFVISQTKIELKNVVLSK